MVMTPIFAKETSIILHLAIQKTMVWMCREVISELEIAI